MKVFVITTALVLLTGATLHVFGKTGLPEQVAKITADSGRDFVAFFIFA